MLWNLTTLSFVNFQGKLNGTSWNLFACEAKLVKLVVFLAQGADFGSTHFLARLVGHFS
jgi:hypothetical protein